MSNLLQAVYNIVDRQNSIVEPFSLSSIRANNMGESLEEFIKNAFASTFNINSHQERINKMSSVFSWQGSQNHPPNIILKGSDAIEVKKSESSKYGNIPLNSSYPKSYLWRESKMLTKACQNCEENWDKKEIIYSLGNVQKDPKSKDKLKSIWFIYGSLYAEERECYERISDTVIGGLNEISDVRMKKTKELGRINQIDPLGITNLRICGMWEIQHPNKVFKNILEEFIPSEKTRETFSFQLLALIPYEKKYKSFDNESKENLNVLKRKFPNFTQKILDIPNPNNPSLLVKTALLYILCYLISS